MKRREMKLLLEERFERIALLETRIDTLDQLVDGYRTREQSIFNTLQAAKDNAAAALEQAKSEGVKKLAEAETLRAEADRIRSDAQQEAEALLSQAIVTAKTLKQEAERKGNEMTADIRADSERMLKDAQIIKREYEEMVESFNAMLEQNASELEVTAARFAEFVKNRKIDRAEARLDGDAFYKSVGEMNNASLPDASENPSILMQNIYRIQNRPLPEDRPEQPEPAAAAKTADAQTEEPAAQKSIFSMEVGADANETANTADSFSEAAWASDAHKSESEPQAEFTRSFDPDFVRSDYTIHQDECAVTTTDAEDAFDTLVTDAEPSANVALPLGSAIVAAGLGEQPMAETVRAVDDFFDAAMEPGGETAQDEAPNSMQESPQDAALSAEEPAQTAAIPEPFSEQAWTQSSAVSELEPQAEGTLFSDVNEIAREAAQVPVAPTEQSAARAPEAAATAKQPVSSEEVVSALDDYFDQIDVSAPTLPHSPANRPATAPEAYSEKAWAQSDMASDHEPQAEGALFGDVNDMLPDFAPASAATAGQFVPTAFGVFPVNKPVSASEAEHAFDAYLNQIDKKEKAVTEPAPYSEQAWVQSEHASEHEPQAEGALFADVNAFEPEFTPAAGAPVEPVRTMEEAKQPSGPVTANDAVNVFDDYLAQMEPFAPTVPETPVNEPASAPEPYSEQAWSYTPNVSEYEPQAEGESIISVYDPDKKEDTETAFEPSRYEVAFAAQEPEEEEEPEPKPAPRRYNEYGEIREWEPEPEPEMSDIPTVSRYMGESGGSDDISLDELLDEIIKAGE